MEIRTEVQTVTPKLATEWLAASQGNRHMRHEAVAGFAQQMKRGDWQLNGEAIVFDETGRLINGHHRLMAVIVAGCDVKMLVTMGVKPEAIFTVDTGTSRTLADHLTLNAGTNSKVRGSYLGMCVRILCGFTVQLRTIESYRSWEPIFHKGTEKYLELGCFTKPLMRRATVASPLILAHKHDEQQVEQMMVDLRDGSNLMAGDPMLTLREYLSQTFNKERRGDDTVDQQMSKVFGAILARLEGRTLRKLQASAEATDFFRKLYTRGAAAQLVNEARRAQQMSRALAARFDAGESTIEDIKKAIAEVNK